MDYDGPTSLHNESDQADADPLPKLSEEQLVDWQHAIGALSKEGYTLSAPTVEEASTTLIDLLAQLVVDTPPSECIPNVEGSGISCTIKDVDQLLYPLPPFAMYVTFLVSSSTFQLLLAAPTSMLL